MVLTERQLQLLQRLFVAGFRPIAIPPYESGLCMHRGECAVLLAPVDGSGLRILAPASFLVDGKFGVRVKRGEREMVVSKQKELEVTPERLKELEQFQATLTRVLAENPLQ